MGNQGYKRIDIDTESDKRGRVFKAVQDYFKSIGGDLVNVCTFGTEGTKAAIKDAARGLDVPDEVVSYLTSMIPNERGFDWSLHDCYYGNEERERKPISAFKKEMDMYPDLWELAQAIEGIITRLGVHASGVVAMNGGLTDNNSIMKTNHGQLVTAYDLDDLEYRGKIKYDFLTVSALDRIRQTFNYLLEDKVIQWYGSLRVTFDHYLSPAVLNYTDKQMWDMVDEGKITSLFQFDTVSGGQGIQKVQPRSLQELAITNSVIRLMTDNKDEQPIDIYAKYKLAPQLWYDEMNTAGLNADEIKILEKYLKKKCGVADSQEVIMQIVMDPHISNFTMKEANRLRKTIAKKQYKEVAAVKDLFYIKGKACGSSKALLDYVWNVQVSRQLGYSFSEVHTTAYSLIALEEMNLARFYPIIYWNTACLSVDAGAINASDFYNLTDEGIIDISDDDDSKSGATKNKMDYAKVAGAIDKFRKISTIKLPDINKSRLGFTPDADTNTILYGLKGISRITEPAIKEIILNRPYKSLDDFLSRVSRRILTKDKIINLIKCGAFDSIEHKSRKDILSEFLWGECEPKKKLTMQNANMLIQHGLLPASLNYQMDLYYLTKEMRKHRDPDKLWYIGSDIKVTPDKAASWGQIIQDSKITPVSLVIAGKPCHVIDSTKWDNFYKDNMEKIKSYINSNEEMLLKKLNQGLFDEQFNKYCQGGELDWELDSINFYFSGNPLIQAIQEMEAQLQMMTTPIADIVEGAQDGEFYIRDKLIPKMKLYTIVGTVIDRNKTKGLVTVQTPDGIISVKVYKNLFALYNQTIMDAQGNLKEPSFFDKGTNIVITGIKRGFTFVPKVYKRTKLRQIMRFLTKNGHFAGLEEKTGDARQL